MGWQRWVLNVIQEFCPIETLQNNYLNRPYITLPKLLDGIELTAKGDSKDKLVAVGASTTQTIEGKNVLLSGSYNLLKKKLGGSAKVSVDDTTVELGYDNVDKDAKLKVSQK